MNTIPASKLHGLVFGAFVADSFSLGPHWIYDCAEIRKRFEPLNDFQAPATSYHPGKMAGDQTHLGDQAWLLAQSLQETGGIFQPANFMNHWQKFWSNPSTVSYRDKATRTTLDNIARGIDPMDAGAASTELAGIARGAPLAAIVLACGGDAASVAAALSDQASLTHESFLCDEAAHFLGLLLRGVCSGQTVNETLNEALLLAGPDVRALIAKADNPALQSLSTAAAVEQLGQSCDLSAALPASILILRRATSYENAIIENALSGGDSAARGLLIGAVLGAAHGIESLPQRWRSALKLSGSLEEFCRTLN